MAEIRMPNMDPKKAPMPAQDPNVRNKNFQEVCTWATPRRPQWTEATRCLHCKNHPCVAGCPVSVHIPDFIAKVAEGDFKAAYEIITGTNALPAISGRVCPQESQCESQVRPRHQGRAGRPSAVWSASWPTGTARTC